MKKEDRHRRGNNHGSPMQTVESVALRSAQGLVTRMNVETKTGTQNDPEKGDVAKGGSLGTGIGTVTETVTGTEIGAATGTGMTVSTAAIAVIETTGLAAEVTNAASLAAVMSIAHTGALTGTETDTATGIATEAGTAGMMTATAMIEIADMGTGTVIVESAVMTGTGSLTGGGMTTKSPAGEIMTAGKMKGRRAEAGGRRNVNQTWYWGATSQDSAAAELLCHRYENTIQTAFEFLPESVYSPFMYPEALYIVISS